MKTSEIFEGLLTNLQVDNAGTIGARRDEIRLFAVEGVEVIGASLPG